MNQPQPYECRAVVDFCANRCYFRNPKGHTGPRSTKSSATVSHPSTNQDQDITIRVLQKKVMQIWLCGATPRCMQFSVGLARLCAYQLAVVLGHQGGWGSEMGARMKLRVEVHVACTGLARMSSTHRRYNRACSTATFVESVHRKFVGVDLKLRPTAGSKRFGSFCAVVIHPLTVFQYCFFLEFFRIRIRHRATTERILFLSILLI